jgi:hypothetical protein
MRQSLGGLAEHPDRQLWLASLRVNSAADFGQGRCGHAFRHWALET